MRSYEVGASRYESAWEVRKIKKNMYSVVTYRKKNKY